MNTTHWIGKVISNDDEEHRGRLQVQVFGVHDVVTSVNKNTGQGIKETDCPWALCSMPLTYGGTSESTMPVPQCRKGAWVHGISFDEAYTKLLVLGLVSGNTSIINSASKNEENSSENSWSKFNKVLSDTSNIISTSKSVVDSTVAMVNVGKGSLQSSKGSFRKGRTVFFANADGEKDIHISNTGKLDESKILVSCGGKRTTVDKANKNITNVVDLQPRTKDFINTLAERYYQQTGKRLVISGGAESTGGHKSGTYSHANGYKLDLAKSDENNDSTFWTSAEGRQLLEDTAKEFGNVKIYDEDSLHYDITVFSENYRA